MRKVCVILILIIVMALTATCPAFAADVLWRLTHGDQYSLAIAEVEKVDGNILEVRVAHVISGNLLKQQIKVEVKEWNLQLLGQSISQGDKVIISLDKDEANYSIKWGIYKVSSLDWQTLKIIAPTKPAGDMAAFQWYVNSGGKDNDFYFKSGEAYVRDKSGTSLQIYPLPSTDQPSPTHSQATPTFSYRSAVIYVIVGGVALMATWFILKLKFWR